MNQEQDTPTLVWNDGIYQISDLREDALEVVNDIRANQALVNHHQLSLKQLESSMVTLRDRLNRALVGVKHQKVSSKSLPVDLTEQL